MFSLKNSYDYKNKYNNKDNILPFIGTYESVDNYKFIYIYAFSEQDDTLTIQYTNTKNDNTVELEESYSITANVEKEITLPKKLKFFRIKIITNTFNLGDKRIYNTYLLDSQYVKISGGGGGISSSVNLLDENGNALGATGDALNVSVRNTSIAVTNSDLTAIKTSVELIDNAVSGNFLMTKINDSSGNSIHADSYNSLKTSIYNSNGNPNSNSNPLIISENSYNLHRDAFNRLRVSHPFTIFDSKNIGKINNKFTDYKTNSNGVTYDINSSSVLLNCDASNTIVIRESKNSFAYQPGKSLLILNTFVFGNVVSNTSNILQRVGYFDDYNGIFLQIDPSGVFISKRSNSSGTITDTPIELNNWNGSPDAKNLDFSKAQIFWIDIEWLGVGSVRTGFVLDGIFILAHTFYHSNIVNNTYMTTAQLPIRYEIRRILNNGSLKQICSSVISEGGYEGNSLVRHVGSNSNSTLITQPGSGTMVFIQDTDICACAIRIKKLNDILYNSIVLPSQLAIFLNNEQGNNSAKFPIVEYKLYLNPSGVSYPGTWEDYSTNFNDISSKVEYVLYPNITFTNITGPIIQSGFLEGKSNINLASSKDFNMQLGKNITGYNTDKLTYESDIILLVLKPLYLNSTAPIINVAYQLGWYEI